MHLLTEYGAVLSHHLDEKIEWTIAFASQSLPDAKRQYSHLEKEALAIAFDMKHFLFGR